MDTKETTNITVQANINTTIGKVWELWTLPEHIVKWNFASDDWHTPIAENNLKVGGRFVSRMEAKDGSFGFDFGGVYEEIKENEYLAAKLDDGRKLSVTFLAKGNETHVIETFQAENTNPIDVQRNGWQATLNNFKKYAESKLQS